MSNKGAGQCKNLKWLDSGENRRYDQIWYGESENDDPERWKPPTRTTTPIPHPSKIKKCLDFNENHRVIDSPPPQKAKYNQWGFRYTPQPHHNQ